MTCSYCGRAAQLVRVTIGRRVYTLCSELCAEAFFRRRRKGAVRSDRR